MKSGQQKEDQNSIADEQENSQNQFNAKFENYDPKEEATLINSLTYLQFQPVMAYIIVPFLIFASGFILGLFLYWNLKVRAYFMFKKVKKNENPTHLFVQGSRETVEIVKLFSIDQNSKNDTFRYRYINFQYFEDVDCFKPIQFDSLFTHSQILEKFNNGIKQIDQPQLISKYGPCLLEIPSPNFFLLLINELLNPFYIFQVYSIIVWFVQEYDKYPYFLIFLTTFGICQSLYEQFQNIAQIKQIAMYECQIEVKRVNQEGNSFHETISSKDLVPGDLAVIPNENIMPCDMILLNGSCVINEAILTGESAAVVKNCIVPSAEIYDQKNFQTSKKFTIFCGTQVLQTRSRLDEKVYGLVTKTGFLTTKGGLVREILYPSLLREDFFYHSMLFVACFTILFFLAFASTVRNLIDQGNPPDILTLKVLDLSTIAVPPQLPTVISVGIGFALTRLKFKNIFCINPQRVNIAGRIQTFVFDKTGTLTEDGLTVYGLRGTQGQIRSAEKGEFLEFHQDLQIFKDSLADDFDYRKVLIQLMASCHSVTCVKDQLLGDPFEIKMFEKTGWLLDENIQSGQILAIVKPNQDDKDQEIAILRRFEFESQFMRSCVIVKKNIDSSYRSFVKGSPEILLELCIPQTIPKDFNQILDENTKKGYRVIGLGAKLLPDIKNYLQILEKDRDYFEKNLHFIGFLFLENKLKEETFESIRILQECEIETIMATGDNTLTAIAVSQQCNILDKNAPVYQGDIVDDQIQWKIQEDQQNQQLNIHGKRNINQTIPWIEETDKFGVALNGKTLKFLYNNRKECESLLLNVLQNAKVYARMSPEDKCLLVQLLQEYMKTRVGMCGDGANDCVALKQADAGISLSDAEASIAAPFTSKVRDISSVITLLIEGKASLASSFQSFKIILLYAATQLVTVMIFYLNSTNLYANQFIWIDIGVLFPLCIFQTFTGSPNKLTKNLTDSSVLGPSVFASVFGMIIIMACFQIYVGVSTNYLLDGDTFISCKISEESILDLPPCTPNTALFLFSFPQYTIQSLSFSVGPPFRQYFFTNPIYTILLILLLAYQLYLIFYIDQWNSETLGLIQLPRWYNLRIFYLFLGNSASFLLYEKVFIQWISKICVEKEQRAKKQMLSDQISNLNKNLIVNDVNSINEQELQSINVLPQKIVPLQKETQSSNNKLIF